MPQVKELSLTPLNYSPPRRSAQAIETDIATMARRRDQYTAARTLLSNTMAQIEGHAPGMNSESYWVPPTSDVIDMNTWLMFAMVHGGSSMSGMQYSRSEQRRYLIDALRERAEGSSRQVTNIGATLRALQTELVNASKPKPDDIILKRENLRAEFKTNPHVPLRSLNLGVVNGVPTLTWRFDGLRCTPNDLPADRGMTPFNAGAVPSFGLPSMLGSLPLTRGGVARFRLARGYRGVTAFSRNAVHPHQMNDRTMCLGDYKATIEELKFAHDFAGVIMLYQDFMQRCEPTDAAGASYWQFIQHEIRNQLGVEGESWRLDVGLPYVNDMSTSNRKRANLWLHVSPFPRNDGATGSIRHFGRLARLRGQWVFQPTKHLDGNHSVFERVYTWEETCALRDSLKLEQHQAFFAKDLDEYNLLARMVTDNVPIQYNESTALVLNALNEAELVADDEEWSDSTAEITEYTDNDDHDNGDGNDGDGDGDDEEEPAEEDAPYIDEPY